MDAFFVSLAILWELMRNSNNDGRITIGIFTISAVLFVVTL